MSRFWLVAAGFALACTRAVEPSTQTASPLGVKAASSAEAPAPAEDQAHADRVVAEALNLVSSVRELSVRANVPGVRLDRKALQAEVEKMLRDEAPPELVAGNTELLFALDAVSASFDLKSTLSLLYGAQLAGFYDPDKKRMVLASDLGEDAERMTLYHELVHALQDQHYDLGQALDWKPERSDAQAALHSLGEGDATAAMVEVFARAQGLTAQELPAELLRLDSLLMQASPDLSSVPGIILRSLIAPYADGLTFVTAMRKRFGGFSGVDGAWRDRPLSTEHILHPEKYLAREPVFPVPAIEAPAGFAEPPFRDVMGEQSLRLVFEEWMPAGRAAESASDWGGDRFAIFADGERRAVLWHLVFDTEPAAARAQLAFARGALRPELSDDWTTGKTPRPFLDIDVAQTRVRAGKVCQERPQRGAFAIVRHGRHVGVTLGPYARTRTGVRQAGTCPQALQWADQLARRHQAP